MTVAVTVQPPGGAIQAVPAALPRFTLSPVPIGSSMAGVALGVGETLGVGSDVGETVLVGVCVGVEEGLPPGVSDEVELAVLGAVRVGVAVGVVEVVTVGEVDGQITMDVTVTLPAPPAVVAVPAPT